jgi:hypothetical protein
MSYEADPGFLFLNVFIHGSRAGDGRHVRDRREMCHGTPGFCGARFIFVVAGRGWAAGTITAKIISPNARIMPHGKEREVPAFL